MKVAVLGAGKTGRGFLGRLLQETGQEIVFIDSKLDLVHSLHDKGSYMVTYFGGEKAPSFIHSYTAYHTSDGNAIKALASADIIFVSVGVENFPEAAKMLAQAVALNLTQKDVKSTIVVTAENAIDPAEKLSVLIHRDFTGVMEETINLHITESAIFCSTMEDHDSPINILSEVYDELPFDLNRLPLDFSFPNFMKPIKEFSLLLTKKIFTYNCASAAIAYLGDYQGQTLYGEAANDPLVVNVLSHLYSDINKVLCIEYGLDEESQVEFARKSLNKFQNRLILDSIERNARDVRRKLFPDERMIGPLRLLEKQRIESKALALVVAAAIRYGKLHDPTMHEMLVQGGVDRVLTEICSIERQNIMYQDIVGFFDALITEQSLKDIIELVG